MTKKTKSPNFPPKLKLKGVDGEGAWKVRITGTMVVTADPTNDPSIPPRGGPEEDGSDDRFQLRNALRTPGDRRSS